RHGVAGVTIRRVAAELGRSTATVTHYAPDRRSLLDAAVGTALDRRRAEAEQVVAAAVDPLRALLAWSVGSDDDVWRALVAAVTSGVEPAIDRLVIDFDRWWEEVVRRLLRGRLADGVDEDDAVAAIGAVVDGLLLTPDAAALSTERRHRVLQLVLGPMLRDGVTGIDRA
ncbi:MAG TPA: hypothetical protein VK866_07865, partial [Acidimicrobiales bacterium]|nr:hypothetical protein [Acidimicrobiales bacterium]